MSPISADRILYCDDHLLAVAKRSGELTVRGKGALGKLPLFDLLKKDYPGLRVLHRLDFETSGVVLFARTKKAYEGIRAVKTGDWRKTYHALIEGCPARLTGTIRTPLPARGQGLVPAQTRYRILERFALCSYVEAVIETGRHHQIRRHFAEIGHPLLLDREYGNARANAQFSRESGYNKFFLHAFVIDLLHPVTGKKLHIEAPLPRAFTEVLKRLRDRR
ncbi:MAG: RluA family pseudouridine synthase [Candidatus Peribacteraceae bacterium]|jgi:23S rRNA pseudouridine955/2504/2580 synthase